METKLGVDWKDESVSLYTMDGLILARSRDSAKGRVYEHIVACVNACAGIDDPADLRVQRDELAAALHNILSRLSRESIEAHLHNSSLTCCERDCQIYALAAWPGWTVATHAPVTTRAALAKVRP